jgi:signal transduction histidine kinase
MTDKPEEALQAADEVERLEEKVDDLFEESRRLLGKEERISVGVAILINELYEAIEMTAVSNLTIMVLLAGKLDPVICTEEESIGIHLSFASVMETGT